MEKPKLKLLGEDGNAFSILGRAQRAAKKAGWTDAEWQAFQDKAMSGNYQTLLCAVMDNFDCDSDDDGED